MEEGQECRGRRTNDLDIYTCVCVSVKKILSIAEEIYDKQKFQSVNLKV